MALIDAKTAEDFYAYLQRLYGRTYGSNSESSIFQRQLRSWAVLLATGRSEIDRAFLNAFPDLADAMVVEWEQAYNLPNDSARTLAERQARLAAHERTQRGAARSDLQDSLDATGVLASFVANRRDEVLMQGSEDAAIFQSTLQLANEDFYDPILREAVETIYGNASPAKNVGALDRPGADQSTCVETDSEWNSTTHHVGRDAIARQVTTLRSEFMTGNQIARARSFGPGSRINAQDLNRIQEAAFGSPLTGELGQIDLSAVGVGLEQYWFGAALTSGVAVQLDTSIDWRDRMLMAVFARSSEGGGGVLALTPGEANDDAWGDHSVISTPNVDENATHIYVYTGPGSTGAGVHRGYTSAGQEIALYSDTLGDLYVLSPSANAHVCGCIFITPQLGV